MVFLYDGTFGGLLTTIFESYLLKSRVTAIQAKQACAKTMFEQYYEVHTEVSKVERVFTGIRKRMGRDAIMSIYKAFLSSHEQIEMTILNYVRLAITSNKDIDKDYRQTCVLGIDQAVKKVDREIHRMHGFVRFQKVADDKYAAMIAPDFDVVPFLGPHFKRRFADQCWIIYDVRRDYGLHYDMKEISEIHIEGGGWAGRSKIDPSILSEDECFYQDLWQHYFRSTSIAERKNMRLHLHHLPRRYWRHLPEKYAIRD